jgi:hypothetical protein
VSGIRSVVAVSIVLAGAGSAGADESAPAATVRQRVGMDMGIGSAVGLIGVDYQLAPSPWLRLEGAAGWGVTGAQLSLMPKIALGSGACAFTAGFGAALAVGGQQAMEGHGPNPAAIPWLNLDVPGIECHTRSGFSFEATLGLTMPLTAFHWDVADVGDTVHAGAILPQGRVGIGWWF